MRVESTHRTLLGRTPDGEPVEGYTLSNAHGMQVDISTLGATITRLDTPDRHGDFADVVLGFDHVADYCRKGPYFGATVGRFANRIAGGQFSIDGQSFKLAQNSGLNSIHGGLKGFDKQVWVVEPDATGSSVRMTHHSPDGDEGYPGNLDAAVTFTLTDNNELVLDYEARTDAPTVVNLTNHTYFNLKGEGTIHNHEVTIHADNYTPVSDDKIPTGKIESVAGTPLDFRESHAVGERLGDVAGYDHNYVLPGGTGPVAEVYEPASGRLMQVWTDAPGMQFYTGNNLHGEVGKGGKSYGPHSGLCLETQQFPDSPNQPGFPSPVVRPGQVWHSRTVYRFSVR